jgi:peptidoglycan hydrolase-like protein with peptidoglycan-binding domain
MLTSALFAGDALLEAIAADVDRERISRSQHPDDPAVGKVQTALLLWNPDVLPLHGADGHYGDETAAAVVRVKIEVLGVDAASVIDDVGPRTVQQLDAIAVEHETPSPAGDVDPRVRELVRAILTDSASPSVATLSAELARQGTALTPAQVAAVMARLLDG